MWNTEVLANINKMIISERTSLSVSFCFFVFSTDNNKCLIYN